jgi:hypothetical protein
MFHRISRWFGFVLILSVLLVQPMRAAGRTPNSLPTAPNWNGQSDNLSAHYGYEVAAAGDVNGDGRQDVLIGAPDYDGLGGVDSGRAYLYLGSSPGGLPQYPAKLPNWYADGAQAGARFGYHVAGIGDVNGDGYDDIAISAPYDDSGGETGEGIVYVWYGSASGLACGAGCPVAAASADWRAQVNQSDALLNHVAGGDVNGDGYSDLIAGASQYDKWDSNTSTWVTDTGAVFVWFGAASAAGGLPGSGNGLPGNATWKAYGNQTNDKLGYRVAAVDVKHDGKADVIASSIYYTNGQTNEGAVFAWYAPLSGEGSPANANWKIESNQVDAYLGLSISTAGDVNGDNSPDLVVSAPYYDDGEVNEGMVFVFPGSTGGLPGSGTPGAWQNAISVSGIWRVESNQTGSYLGMAVGSAGDVNTDGYDDLLIGAPRYDDSGNTNRGKVFVFHGSAGMLPCTSVCLVAVNDVAGKWSVAGDQDGAELGYSAAGVGDVNGDYVSDVIVGAPMYDTGKADGGKAFGYYGILQNNPPVAVNDVAGTGSEDQVFVSPTSVLVNDYDPGGNPNRLTAWRTTPSALHGVVVMNTNGFYTYTPAPNWNGDDTFYYIVQDGWANSNMASVTIHINAVNDPPTIANFSKLGARNTPVTFTAANFSSRFSDIDGDSLAKIRVVSLPANGVLSLNSGPVAPSQEIAAADLGKLTFTPTSGWTGSTSFQWNASDGTVYAAAPATVNITITTTLYYFRLPLIKR